uniref:CSON008469 protein n=1 Tax=Culicoides sonorensis TaxID=179676 RepID=A0A336KA11_CULSO
MYPQQQLQDIERQQITEDVPLHDITNGYGTQQRSQNDREQERRERFKKLFDQYDRNNSGTLSVSEMKRLINDHACQNLPSGAAKKILNLGDTDNDGKLSFEEFYKMCTERDHLMRDYAARYCKLVVPRRDMRHGIDEADGAYENSMTFCPPPLTMVIFSIIEIVFFLVDIISLEEHKQGIGSQNYGKTTSGPAATLFIYNPKQRYEAWRFVTYMFVHVGIMHLMMNLIVQLLLGVALELVHHWWRVALVYVAGVAAGSMGTSIYDPRIFLAGASGEMEYAIIQLFVFVVFCGTDIGVSTYRHFTIPNDKIGYMAHLCGGIAGLLVGIGVLRNLEERRWEKKLWWCAVTLYFALMLTGIAIHIFYPEHFLPQKQKNVVQSHIVFVTFHIKLDKMGAIQICANSSEGRNESAIELMEKFNELDKDGNGVIDSQELEKITKGTNYNPEDLIKAADINNDKVLDFREFYNSFKNNKIWKSIFPRPEKSFESDITFYPPLFILIISLIEILFFYVQCKDSIYEKLMYVPEKRGQVWRFITYMLIHQNEKHLFANMSGQIVIGGALEIMNSWWRVALVYLAGGLGGSLWTSIIKPTEMNIGASAGFYALLAGCFATE